MSTHKYTNFTANSWFNFLIWVNTLTRRIGFLRRKYQNPFVDNLYEQCFFMYILQPQPTGSTSHKVYEAPHIQSCNRPSSWVSARIGWHKPSLSFPCNAQRHQQWTRTCTSSKTPGNSIRWLNRGWLPYRSLFGIWCHYGPNGYKDDIKDEMIHRYPLIHRYP